MAYNRSLKTVERNQAFLDKLLSGDIVLFTTQKPHKLAYRLREAIYAAEFHDFEPYCDLDYTFKISAPTELKAIPSDSAESSVSASAEVQDAVKAEKELTQTVNEFDVIAFANKGSEDRFIFHNFDGNLESVKTWSEKNDFSVETNPLTLTRNA